MMSVHESTPWMFPGHPRTPNPLTQPFTSYPTFESKIPFHTAPSTFYSTPQPQPQPQPQALQPQSQPQWTGFSFDPVTPPSTSIQYTQPTQTTQPTSSYFHQQPSYFQQQPQQQVPNFSSFPSFGSPSFFAPPAPSVSEPFKKVKRTMTQLDDDTDSLFRDSRAFGSDSEDSDSSSSTRGHDGRFLSEFPRKRSFDAYVDSSPNPPSPSPSATSASSSPSGRGAANQLQPPRKRTKSMFDKALEQLFEFRFDGSASASSSVERSRRLDARGGKRQKRWDGSSGLDVLEETDEASPSPSEPSEPFDPLESSSDAMGEDIKLEEPEEEEEDPQAHNKQLIVLPAALRYRLRPTVPLPDGVTFDEFFYRPSPHTSFCLLNTSGNILECDKGLPKLLKVSADELRGKSLLAFTHVDDWTVAQHIVRRLMRGDSASELFHQRMVDAKGNTIFVRGNLFRLERDGKVYIVSKITPAEGSSFPDSSSESFPDTQLKRVPQSSRLFAASPSSSAEFPRPSSTLSIEELPDTPADADSAMSCD